jgi:hypothetical protein
LGSETACIYNGRVAGVADANVPFVEDAVAPPLIPLYKKDGKFLRGKNGRLFLDNDRNHVLQQHCGELLFSARDLRRWRYVLETRVAFHERLGIPYLFLVPPNAHSVYPEDLPDDARAGATRPVLQIIDELRANNSFASLIYPLEELHAEKSRLLYPKTDPHWTAEGAFVAYERLTEELSRLVRLHHVAREDVIFDEVIRPGELGYKVEPEETSTDIDAWVTKPAAHLVSDNRVFNTGSIIETKCPEAPPTTCLVLGDSFSDSLWPFLASSFRRFVFAHIPTLDYDFVREQKPDVVITVLNERFLIVIPDDNAAWSIREFEQEKQAHNVLREETRALQHGHA